MLRSKLIMWFLLSLTPLSIQPTRVRSDQSAAGLTKTPLAESGLSLDRRTHPGAFFDVLGRRAAVFGYEHRGFEAWTYPLKVLEDFRLSFSLEGYPLDVPAEEMLASITDATRRHHLHLQPRRLHGSPDRLRADR